MAESHSTPLPLGGIYAIRNTANGKLYVGSAQIVARRLAQHRRALVRGDHHSERLQRAWIKYGADQFEFFVLEPVSDNASLLVREQHWIDEMNAVANGYNILPTAGSCLGKKVSEATKRKIAESLKGKPFTQERLRNMSVAKIGKKPSPEAIAKVVAANTGKKRSPEFCARMVELNRSHSPEKKALISAKISASKVGKKRSEETKAAMRAGHLARKERIARELAT